MKTQTVIEENVNLRTIIYAVLIALGGCVLLYVSSLPFFNSHKSLQSLVQNIGGLGFASVALSLAWELKGKRAFLHEILNKVNISENLKSSGILKVYDDIYEISADEWKEYVAPASEIDLCFAYGNLWRNANRHILSKIADQRRISIRLIVPDPNSEEAVSVLAKRFKKSPDDITSRIIDTLNFFTTLQQAHPKMQLSILTIPFAPNFQLYRIDNHMVFGSYSHRNSRPAVPGTLCHKDGIMFKYYREELDYLIHLSTLRSSNNTEDAISASTQSSSFTAT